MAAWTPLLKFRSILDPFYTFQKRVLSHSSYFLGNFLWTNLLLMGVKLLLFRNSRDIGFQICRFPLYFRRKKLQQYRGVQTVEEIDMNGFVQSKPINVTELKQYCIQRHANSDFQFQQEFEVSTYTASSFCYFCNCQ